jgi:ClpA/ClpB-like protein
MSSEKVYRFLLRAYPRNYRTRYAAPMEQLFRDRLRNVHTVAGMTALWVRTLADWAVSVPVRYWERATPHPHHLIFDSLDPARQCLFLARREASSFSRREIQLEHLLLGILRQEPSLVPDPEAVVRAIEAAEPAGRRDPPMEDLRLSRETVRVWESAKQIALTAGRHQVAPRDLAAGILNETDTLAARLLREHTHNLNDRP